MDKHPIAISSSATAMMPVKNMNEIIALGEVAAKSGMFGQITSAAGVMAMLTCYQERITPVEYNNKYHTIEGKPTKRADRVLAEFRQHGGKYKILEASDKRAAIMFTFDGNELLGEMTFENACASGIALGKQGQVKDNWRKFAAQMLFARAVTNGVRMIMPEIMCGMYSPEEVSEFNDSNPLPVEPMEVPRADDEIIDYTVCPVEGQLKGVKWVDMPLKHLEFALKIDRTKHPELTDSHIAEINIAMDALLSQPAIEPEVVE